MQQQRIEYAGGPTKGEKGDTKTRGLNDDFGSFNGHFRQKKLRSLAPGLAVGEKDLDRGVRFRSGLKSIC